METTMNPTTKTGQTSGGKAEIGSKGACVLAYMCVWGGTTCKCGGDSLAPRRDPRHTEVQDLSFPAQADSSRMRL